MSEIRVNKVINEAGTGSVELTQGATLPATKSITGAGSINVTGIATANSFSASNGFTGNLTGTATTANNSTTAYGLSGAPNISVGTIGAGNVTSTGTIAAVDGSFSGNISVGGTLTYEDVTNQDVIGLSTFRAGVDFNGFLREEVKITAGKLSDNQNINLDNGMVHYFTTTETTTSTPNITASAGINTIMSTGDTMVVTIITTAAAGAYSAQLTIEGAATTENWIGGEVPAAGGASGVDIYSYTIIKTGAGTTDFTVIGNLSKTSA